MSVREMVFKLVLTTTNHNKTGRGLRDKIMLSVYSIKDKEEI